jgi:hypothetical protein
VLTVRTDHRPRQARGLSLQAFVAIVEAFTGRPARPGHRGVMLACPAHEDRRESMSVSQGAGKILVHDFGGCRVEAIVDALGLKMTDLFSAPRVRHRADLPPTSLEAMRAAGIQMALRQAWARPDVLDLYEAADAMRWADRIRRRQTEDTPGAWDVLTNLAAIDTAAEDVWAAALS